MISYEYLVKADSYLWDGPLYLGMTGELEDVITDERRQNNTHAVNFIALIPDSASKQQMYEYARTVVPETKEHNFVQPADLHLRLVSTEEKFSTQRATSRPFTIPAKDVKPEMCFWQTRNEYILLLTFRSRRLTRRYELLQKKTEVTNRVNRYQMHIVLAFDVDPERGRLPPWTSQITFGGYRNKFLGGLRSSR